MKFLLLFLSLNAFAQSTNNFSVLNNLTLSGKTASRACYLDSSKIVQSSSTTSAELDFLSGVTSSVQTQLNSKQQGPLIGDVTTSGTTATLANTAVTPGSYTTANITVDSKGRVTAASSGSAPEVPLTFSSPLSRSVNTVSIPAASTSVDGYLSSTDWNTFNNKVSTTRTINTTSPITGGGDLSSDRTIAIPAASTSVNGYLTSTDWNTFNSKQAALTNPVTGTGTNGLVPFWTGTTSQSSDATFAWDNSNKRLWVGSGTPTPLGPFHANSTGSIRNWVSGVDDTVNSSTSIWNGQFVGHVIRNTSVTVGALAGLQFGLGSSGSSNAGIAGVQETATSLAGLSFYTGGAGRSNTTPERMRIDSAGAVGIGTASPDSSLHVTRSFTATANGQSSGHFSSVITGAATTDHNYHNMLLDGSITANAANATLNGLTISSSLNANGQSGVTTNALNIIEGGTYTKPISWSNGVSTSFHTRLAWIGFALAAGDMRFFGNSGNGVSFSFYPNGSLGMFLDSSQRTCLGTGTCNNRLTVSGSGDFSTGVSIGTTALSSASRLEVVGGAGTAGRAFQHLSGTLNNGGGSETGAHFNITSPAIAGASSYAALRAELQAGYTGTGATRAFYSDNLTAGTGNDLRWASTYLSPRGNSGGNMWASATTTGANVGNFAEALGGNINVGLFGKAAATKNSATNIGVIGQGRNEGTSPIQIGGYFTLGNAAPTFTSSALIADNGDQTSNIFVARDNGSNVVTIADGGGTTFTADVATKSVRGTAVAYASRPGTPVEGMIVAFTDSTTNVWGNIIAGGGSNHVLAYYNGTDWTVIGK